MVYKGATYVPSAVTVLYVGLSQLLGGQQHCSSGDIFAGPYSSKRKSLICASLKLYMAKGTYLSTSDSTHQKGNGVHAVPGSLQEGSDGRRWLVQVR